jgi:hypothetical protein
MFCAAGLVFDGTEASGPVYMFCAPGLVFGGTDGVGSRFHVMRSCTRFWRYRGRQVPFSCFALPNSFSTVPKASGPVFMFCAPGLVFCGIEGLGSRFHVFPAHTHFWRYRGRRVPFLIFSALELVFGGDVRVGSCFHVLLPDSFSALSRTLRPVFMFCSPGLDFDDTEGVRSRFYVFRAHTRFRRYRVRRDPISCFARPFSFSAVPRALGPVIMFCSPRLVIMFCTPGRNFSGTEGVGSHFHILRAMTRFRRCLVRRVPI